MNEHIGTIDVLVSLIHTLYEDRSYQPKQPLQKVGASNTKPTLRP